MRDLCASNPLSGAFSIVPAGVRRTRGGSGTALRTEALLLLGTPREILARIVPADPLGMRGRVGRRLAERAFLADADRVLLRSYALCAHRAASWRGRPALGVWLDERVDEALDQLCEEEPEPSPDGPFRALARPLGLNPRYLALACNRFDRLAKEDREAFLEVVVEGRSLDGVARARSLDASTIAHRVRRVIDLLRRIALSPIPLQSTPSS